MRKKEGTPMSEYTDIEVKRISQESIEILCSKGLGGAALNKQVERKITEGFCTLRIGVY